MNATDGVADYTPGEHPPVFLQHGIADSADCWIMNTPAKSEAFELVRLGYDVWLGNNRGNGHSMKHVNLTVKDKAFWEFSFTELGTYDAPKQVDLVRNITGSDKIAYVGHSQGVSQLIWGMAANGSFWEERLNLFVGLAPVTRLENCGSLAFRLLGHFWRGLAAFSDKHHLYYLLGKA